MKLVVFFTLLVCTSLPVSAGSASHHRYVRSKTHRQHHQRHHYPIHVKQQQNNNEFEPNLDLNDKNSYIFPLDIFQIQGINIENQMVLNDTIPNYNEIIHSSINRPHSLPLHESTHPDPSQFPRQDGLYQHYPSHLNLQFIHYNDEYSIHYQLLDTLYAPFSTANIHLGFDEEGEIIQPMPNRLTVYHSQWHGGWSTLTIHADKTFHATVMNPINQNGKHIFDTIELHPILAHKFHLSEAELQQLHDVSPHKMIAYKRSHLNQVRSNTANINDENELGVCLALKIPKDEQDEQEQETTQMEQQEQESEDEMINSSSRRLLFTQGNPAFNPNQNSNPTLPTRWNNCYPGDQNGVIMSIGIFVSYGFYNQNDHGGMDYMNAFYANVNAVYQAQLGVSLQITHNEIRTTPTNEVFNVGTNGNSGPLDGNVILDSFRNWRSSNRKNQASVWQLHTDHNYINGVAGIGYLASLCNSDWGISFRSVARGQDFLWEYAGHEMGHNFGADHTFQNGMHRTGGIMDYGDVYGASPNGNMIEFNTQFSKNGMCTEISHKINTQGIAPFCFKARSSPPPPPPSNTGGTGGSVVPGPATNQLQFYHLQANQGLCLDAGNIRNSAPIQVAHCNGGPAQHWNYNNNNLVINGLCLDVPNGNTAQGASLQLWQCNGNSAQKFSIINGSIVWTGGNGMCVDIDANNVHDGTRVVMFPCHSGNNQQFMIQF